MYKVFFNNKFVLVTERFETELFSERMLYLKYTDFDEIHFLLDLLENSEGLDSIMISSSHIEELWADFRAHFKEIDAAGGAVMNNNFELLFIHRNGFLDLPKGKLEKDETPEIGALREVEEECGVKDLVLAEHLVDTYHSYYHKGFRVLKKTYWFRMYSNQNDFEPQLEEGIDKVWWEKVRDLHWNDWKTYPSIELVANCLIGQL